MFYTVIKHDCHLRTRGKCRKHEPQASVFYISRVFSNDWSVLSQCNTRHRLLHLLLHLLLRAQTNKTRFFYVLYSDKTWVFDQSKRAQSLIYILKRHIRNRSTNQIAGDSLFSSEIILNAIISIEANKAFLPVQRV